MAKNRFSESHGIMPLVLPSGLNYNGGGDCDCFDMSKYNHATIIFMGDASVAGNGILTIYGGASDAAKTAACGFSYRYSSGNVSAASSDVLGTVATVAAGSTLTITGASLASRMLIVELDASDLVVSGTQYRYVTPSLNADGTGGTCGVVVILSEPRFEEAVMDTANPA